MALAQSRSGHVAAPGAVREPGLQPGDLGASHSRDPPLGEVVVVGEAQGAALDRERHLRRAPPGDRGDPVVGQVGPCQRGEVIGARGVAGVLQPGGPGEPRAAEPHPHRPAVHPLHEGADGARVVLGEGDGRIVARGQQQAQEEAVERHPPTRLQHADPRTLHPGRLGADHHPLARPVALCDQQRGHHLGQARDRALVTGVPRPQDLAAVHVEQDPGGGRLLQPRAHRRRRGRRADRVGIDLGRVQHRRLDLGDRLDRLGGRLGRGRCRGGRRGVAIVVGVSIGPQQHRPDRSDPEHEQQRADRQRPPPPTAPALRWLLLGQVSSSGSCEQINRTSSPCSRASSRSRSWLWARALPSCSFSFWNTRRPGGQRGGVSTSPRWK